MLYWDTPEVPVHRKRAFELAAAGAGMGCAHSTGELGGCYAYVAGEAENKAKGLALGRDSAAAGRAAAFASLWLASAALQGVALGRMPHRLRDGRWY